MKDIASLIPLSTRRFTSGRVEIVEDLLEIAGQQKVFSYMSIRDGVCILPFYQGKIVLLHEYRYPLHDYQWSVPGGILDGEEAPAEAASRELMEETGFQAGEIHPLGSVYTSFGSSDERIHLFWTECTMRLESTPEETEFLEVYLKDEAEFRGMVAGGMFMHGAGLAAWGRYLNERQCAESAFPVCGA